MKVLLSTAAAVALAAGPAQAVVIDSFTTDQTAEDLVSTPPPPSELELDGLGGEVLGGSRDVDAINDDGRENGTQANVAVGAFNVSNAADTSGDGVLTYDGDDDAPAAADVATFGLGGVDLTEGLVDNAFVFDVASSDFSFDYTLTAWDADSFDSVSGALPAAASNVAESIAFSSFSGIDFTDVGAVQLLFSGPPNGDLTIDDFRTVGAQPNPVPLPATLPLLAAGLLGAGALVRRGRRA